MLYPYLSRMTHWRLDSKYVLKISKLLGGPFELWSWWWRYQTLFDAFFVNWFVSFFFAFFWQGGTLGTPSMHHYLIYSLPAVNPIKSKKNLLISGNAMWSGRLHCLPYANMSWNMSNVWAKLISFQQNLLIRNWNTNMLWLWIILEPQWSLLSRSIHPCFLLQTILKWPSIMNWGF